MNLIEIAEDLKDVPDQYLMQEIQQPTGNFPAYLVVSELSRRKRMRDKVAKEMPSQTVAQELATPPQMPQQMPQGMAPQGLMAMPQAQTELAAQDAMGTTPPEMMMPQMASGGIVSFRDGGDVIRAFDGLPEEFFTSGIKQPSIPRGELTELMTLPELQQYNRTGVIPERLRSRIGTSLIESGSLFGGLPISTGQAQFPSAVIPAAVAPAAPAGAAPAGAAPAGAPPAPPAPPPAVLSVRDPVARSGISQFRDSPALIDQEGLIAAGRKGIEEYERAAPDRLTPFLREAISKREGDIKGLRDSNINQALIRAGLEIADKGIIKGAGKGLDAYQQGAKDIRQSEDALMESRAKMAQAQMLFDQNKLGAAQKAREEAARLNELAIKKGDSDNAQIYRTLELGFKGRQADAAERRAQFEEQTLPAKIGLLEAQTKAQLAAAEASRRFKPADDTTILTTRNQVLKARGITLDEYNKNPTTRSQVDQEVSSNLQSRGLAYSPIVVQQVDRGNM